MSPRSQDIKQAGLVGFLAQPDAPTKGGVVILPTIYGVNAFVRGYAETLARAGLAAAAWDMHDGLPLITDYEESKQRARRHSDAGAQAAIRNWTDYLTDELRLTSVDPVTRSWRRFCRKLARRGAARRPAEGPRDFARRAGRELPQFAKQIAAITELYVELRYADTAARSRIRRLREMVRAL